MIQWGFGFDGARRWRGGANAATVEVTRSNGVGGGARNTASSAITEILDTYDRKADEDAVRMGTLEEERAEFRARAEKLLDEIIEPTLEAIGQEILARGHHWTVEERIDIQAQPAVSCLFRGRPTGAEGGPASELTFRCLFPDRVSSTMLVHRSPVAVELPARSHLTSSVNAELVRNEVARFIKQVLAAK